MTVLVLEDVFKKFGHFTALDGINLKVSKGEVHGFIGPNGAGKSTTIRAILGMIKVTSGNVNVFGLDAWKDNVNIHRRISYVPGDVNLWPNLTGGEVIDLLLKLKGQKTIINIEELIHDFDLDPSKKCRTYSKGNRQKIALIAALASDSDLYIFDEPTSGLDPLMERVFHKYVHKAKAHGKSILLSSHILSEVEKLCDTVSIIREGKIIETGSLQELKHLTRVNLSIETKQSITDLHELKGIHNIKQNKNAYFFQIDNTELDQVINYVSTYGIIKLESTPPTLEDLFMRHYAGTDL